MRSWICFDGSEHPVSKRFLAIVPGDLSGRPYAEVEGERQRLLRTGTRIDADGKPHFYTDELTPKQRKRLRGIDFVLNMNRALQFLDGRDYRSHNELFGPEGTLCQVHGQYWSPDTCGCKLSIIFDHWLRFFPKRLIHYPHHFGVVRCSKHRHLTDYSDHFYAVLEENRAKNRRVPNPPTKV